MFKKVIKENNLIAHINTKEGINATLCLEKTKIEEVIYKRGYGTYSIVESNFDFLLGHTKGAVELSEDIDVFELVNEYRENEIKVELDYKGYDLLQVTKEQSFEVCKIRSKLTGEEYTLKCIVNTRIPLYTLRYIPDKYVRGFNSETQRFDSTIDAFEFPYVYDEGSRALRTTLIYNTVEDAYEISKHDVIAGYYPQYSIDGTLFTPIESCGDFSVARIQCRSRIQGN